METPLHTLQCHTIEPLQAVQSVVIWLHGLGASNHDFDAIIPYLQQKPHLQHARFIFPQAPNRSVTLNQGYVMPAWYDILQIDRHGPQDQAGIEASSQELLALIQAQIAQGIAAENIYLIGFSQGSAMVLYTSLIAAETFGGIVGLSGYMPLLTQLQQLPTLNTRNRYWMAHGEQDQVVPIQFDEDSAAFLQSLGCQVQFQRYAMEHEISLPEIDAMAAWLSQCMGNEG